VVHSNCAVRPRCRAAPLPCCVLTWWRLKTCSRYSACIGWRAHRSRPIELSADPPADTIDSIFSLRRTRHDFALQAQHCTAVSRAVHGHSQLVFNAGRTTCAFMKTRRSTC
jgi:hypothetical protein